MLTKNNMELRLTNVSESFVIRGPDSGSYLKTKPMQNGARAAIQIKEERLSCAGTR